MGGRCGESDWRQLGVTRIDWSPSSERWAMQRCWNLATYQCCNSAWKRKRWRRWDDSSMLSRCQSAVESLENSRSECCVTHVMMRDFRLLMLGRGGCVIGRVGLGFSDWGEHRGPFVCSFASEEPPSCLWAWGSCSRVSCNSRLVSWIRRSICRWRGNLERQAWWKDTEGHFSIVTDSSKTKGTLKPAFSAVRISNFTMKLGFSFLFLQLKHTLMTYFLIKKPKMTIPHPGECYE